MKHINDRRPNFYSHGRFFLVKCFHCADEEGYPTENWTPAVPTGECAWCGWKPPIDVEVNVAE